MATKPKGGLAVVVGVGKPKGPPEDDMDMEEGLDNPLVDELEGEEPAAEEYSEGSYPEFTIPEGLDLSDLEDGDEKEVLCVIRKTSETEACIKQVDGVDLAGEGVGMAGPPPAAPVPPPPPAGGVPPPGMPLGPGGPPVAGPAAGPGMPVRRRAMGAGLM